MQRIRNTSFETNFSFPSERLCWLYLGGVNGNSTRFDKYYYGIKTCTARTVLTEITEDSDGEMIEMIPFIIN